MNLGEALRVKAREQGIQWLSQLSKDEELERKRIYSRNYWRKKHGSIGKTSGCEQ